MKIRVTATYEYEITPGEGSWVTCATPQECLELDGADPAEVLLQGIAYDEASLRIELVQ